MAANRIKTVFKKRERVLTITVRLTRDQVDVLDENCGSPEEYFFEPIAEAIENLATDFQLDEAGNALENEDENA